PCGKRGEHANKCTRDTRVQARTGIVECHRCRRGAGGRREPGGGGADDAGLPGEKAEGVGEAAGVPGNGEREDAAGETGGPGEVPDEIRCQARDPERAGDGGRDRVPVRGEPRRDSDGPRHGTPVGAENRRRERPRLWERVRLESELGTAGWDGFHDLPWDAERRDEQRWHHEQWVLCWPLRLAAAIDRGAAHDRRSDRSGGRRRWWLDRPDRLRGDGRLLLLVGDYRGGLPDLRVGRGLRRWERERLQRHQRSPALRSGGAVGFVNALRALPGPADFNVRRGPLGVVPS